MSSLIKKEIEWGGRKLTLETGKIANQADGAVIVTYGETVVLCTVVMQKHPRENCDFFPLSVNYREMAFAAGKIPGGFHKREGRLTDKETLTSRLIDRPIRPLFPSYLYNETQIICTVLSHDLTNDPDIVAMVGASAALSISGVPFYGPIAGAKIAYIDEQLILNPTIAELKLSQLDLVVAGTKDSVMMVEAQANELSEVEILDAIDFAHKSMQPVLLAIEELAQMVGKPKLHIVDLDIETLKIPMKDFAKDMLSQAYSLKEKQIRKEAIEHVKKQINDKFIIQDGNDKLLVSNVFAALEADIVRDNIFTNDTRIDGRGLRDIRTITTEIDVLPKVHGSSLFTRGLSPKDGTQAFVVTTLGTSQDEQIVDLLEGETREHFMLHYNFPPYSVGEASALKAPGRREIGHGRLALRAMTPVLPQKTEFPYTIRVVSEVTSCNGSSSMATVCGASLALMDAGVPIKQPVAGIAMGLIKEGDQFKILSDIIGDEDHLGDMDFKVAGTRDGITALQMDIKISGIDIDIMKQALNQAKEGRLYILNEMANTINEPKKSLNMNAPSITTISISKDKIREVIGSGGSVIKKICEVSGAKIDIDDNGIVKIASANGKAGAIAVKMIEDIVLEPEIGKVYSGKVVKVVEFGAFVNFLGSRDGLIHISELAEGRVEQVTDCINEGDEVKVIVLGVDNRGKIKLSLRLVDQETGEVLGQGNMDISNTSTSASIEERSNTKKRRSPDKTDPDDRAKRRKISSEKEERTEKRKYYN